MIAKTLHEKALTLTKNFHSAEAQLLGVLMKMDESLSYLELGHSSLYEYVLNGLGLSEAQSYYFSSVAKKSRMVPRLKDAVDHCEINLSKARRIVPVITTDNADEWITKAATLNQKDLELEVRKVH